MPIEEMNEHAMEIIMHAGDARTLLNQGLDKLYEFNREEYDAKLKEAHKELVEAHRAQTKILEKTVLDESVRPSILFTHAQDTLMTIMSEYNIAKQLGRVVKLIEEKL